MANRVNNWEQLLELANKDLKKRGIELIIGKDDEDSSSYFLNIAYKTYTDTYASGYYEDELGDLINDAWAHARAEAAPQIVYRVTACYDMNISAEEEILIEVYTTEELAKRRVAQLIKKWKDGWKRTEEDADEWTEKEDSLYAWRDSEWNVDISWMPEPIRNEIG